MSVCRVALFATVLALFAQDARAQSSLDAAKLSWALGGEVHNQAYREPSLGVKEDGWSGGVPRTGGSNSARYSCAAKRERLSAEWTIRAAARRAGSTMSSWRRA